MADMYKNQLQELAQRGCLNLPCYSCIREGPDHAPRFKASVNFNGEIFESPTYCTTLRQAEHAAAEAALNVLSSRVPSKSLTSRVLDESGVSRNLLQETAHRAGLKLPVYTTVRSGPNHLPVFTCNVEIAGMTFTGENGKTKKQAQKNAAIAAWSSLTKMPNLESFSQMGRTKNNVEDLDKVNMVSKFVPKDGSRSRRNEKQATGRRMQGSLYNRDKADASDSLYYQQQKGTLKQDNMESSSTQTKINFVSSLPQADPPPSHHRQSTTVQVKKHMVQPSMDEHQRDEDEWPNGKTKVISKQPIEKWDPRNKSISSSFHGENSKFISSTSFSMPTTQGNLKSLLLPHDHRTQSQPTHMEKRLLGAPNQSQTQLYERSRWYYYPRNTAPSVQIRSVIPVCSAAPTPLKPPLMKQVSSASPSSTSSAAAVKSYIFEEENKTKAPNIN